jgi:AcrR family transcriptional regulator
MLVPGRNTTAEASQRDRLVAAMIELSARDGYQGVSVAHITTHAGVSSSTFYELFSDKEDCAVAAYRASTGRVLADMQPIGPDAVASYEDWSQEAVAAIRRLLDAVCADTDAARLLLVESLGGGPRVRAERRAVTGVFQDRAQAMLAATPPEAPRIDLPPVALIGAIRTIVARHLRMSSEDQLPELAAELVGWVRSYEVRPGRTLWSTGPQARLRASQQSEPPPASEPKRLPRGRHRLPPSVVARSHRTRIIHATAQVTREKGYADTTVTDVVSAAGVSRQVFYEHFADKHHAFLEAQHYPAQHIFDRCAAAYFAPADWPERIWNGLRTLLDLVVVHPALSHLRLVECYAAGPAAIRRAEEVTRSFTIFFEEGFGAGGERDDRSRLFSQAITGAIFEIIQRHAARDEIELLPLLLPQLTYIAIAPFTGAEAAIGTIGGLIEGNSNSGERPLQGANLDAG